MKIGIDLLWVRPGICGGTESFIRNLMNGFAQYDKINKYTLFVAEDNADTFRQYEQYSQMNIKVCPIKCVSQPKRILWENLHLDKSAQEEGIDVMFIPVYSKPRTYRSKIPYVCVIHDLQAMHFPQYFSVLRRLFLKYTWRYACKTSQCIVTISEFCKGDLITHFPNVKDKCIVIYNPVEIGCSTLEDVMVEQKYGIKSGAFFYCVSSMLPHKNLETLLKAIALCKKKNINIPLVISGVGGEKEAFYGLVENLGLQQDVIDTGYVTNTERDWMYENCKMFLFPSVFEGFGMPPVEALSKGKNVIMTKESCLKEVTQGMAIYVENPYDEKEWAETIERSFKMMPNTAYGWEFSEYKCENVVQRYLEVFQNCMKI